MPETIGLIERAAALLREREAARPAGPQEQKLDRTQGRLDPPATPAWRGESPAGPVLDIAALARHGIALPSERRSRTAEEFRLIKHNLIAAWPQDAAANQPSSRLIMVAGPRSGEGKTFVALNLALAFAAAEDDSAVFLDLDTEHPMLPSLFGTVPEKGAVDVLAGDAQLHEVLLRTSLPRLSIIPAGRPRPDVPELFSSKRMASLLAELSEPYSSRYVIIDTPPCLITSEAAALAPLVGQIVFVVEAHRTQRQEIGAALNLLGACPRISLLLNKTDHLASQHFGSYGSYYYSGNRDEEQSEVEQP
jgi:receptor protein-tyrosine kinase